MKYFLDTEFIERFTKPIILGWPKPRHVIDLVSIGIVAEDGREYSAISNEYNFEDASQWVKENVIIPLYQHTVPEDVRHIYHFYDFHLFYGKSNKIIADEIFDFINPQCTSVATELFNQHIKVHRIKEVDNGTRKYYAHPEFYGYYADYDWVLFCSLYGSMINLPKGFPKYCQDLKQMIDYAAFSLSNCFDRNDIPFEYDIDSAADLSEYALVIIKSNSSYPIQEKEHDALADARFNKNLFKFLNGPIVNSTKWKIPR